MLPQRHLTTSDLKSQEVRSDERHLGWEAHVDGHSEKVSFIWPAARSHQIEASAQAVASVFRPVLVAIALAGCTQYWAKPGGTPAEFEATKAACQAQAYSQFPPMPQQVMITTGYTTPLQTSCAGSGYAVNCFTTGGQYVPPAYITVDQNNAARNSGLRSCLFAAGWQPVKNKEEAVEVTQSGGGSIQAPAISKSISADSTQRATRYCDNIFKIRQDASMMVVFGNSYDLCFQTRARELESMH